MINLSWYYLCRKVCCQRTKKCRRALCCRLTCPNFWWKRFLVPICAGKDRAGSTWCGSACPGYIIFKGLALQLRLKRDPFTMQPILTKCAYHGASVDFDDVEIHRVESAFGVSRLLEVYVGISEWASRDHVATNADGKHGTSLRKLFVQHGLSDVRMQVANVQRGHWIWRSPHWRHFS